MLCEKHTGLFGSVPIGVQSHFEDMYNILS